MVTLTSSTNPSTPFNKSLLMPFSSDYLTNMGLIPNDEIIDSYGQLVAGTPLLPKEKENPWLDFVPKHSPLGEFANLLPLNKLSDNLGNISEQSFLKYIKELKQQGITYSLTADDNPQQTNCVIAVADFLKKHLTPDQIKSINWDQFYGKAGKGFSYEQRLAGAPGTLSEAGLTDQVLKFRDKEDFTPEKRKAFIVKFCKMIEAGALVKWDLVAQSTGTVPSNENRLNFKPDKKTGRVIGGHEAMLSKKDLELVKDPKTGEVIDVYFRVTGAHSKDDLGVSKRRYSLVKDFLEPGNNLTLATLTPEILSKIADKAPELVASNQKNNLPPFMKLQPFIIP